MQKYKITKTGAELLRLPLGTTILVRVGNKPNPGIWKKWGKAK